MSSSADRLPIRRALLSVSDKTGLIEFAHVLANAGVTLLSTGGTAKAIRDAGLDVTDVSDVTGFPEIMDGRVKTLHPGVHGGLLADRSKPDHVEAMNAHGIEGIDLLVVNLYPFEETLAKGAPADDIIENIDIGGPAMIRAASKNHAHVAVVTDTEDYDLITAALAAGGTTMDERRKLAGIAYARTAAYDSAISTWFASLEEDMPRRVTVAGTLKQTMRYGENPHQSAAFYVTGDQRPGVASARQLQGKELSYNNINDADAAIELVSEFNGGPAVAIIKHANPCGVATGKDFTSAYTTALACDPVSAFGGIIALNGTLDAPTAEEIVKIFTEIVIAPDATDEAVEVFARKKNLRLLLTGGLPDPRTAAMTIKPVAGGFLYQARDAGHVAKEDLRVVTERTPTAQELDDMLFAFTVAKHVKSNAIVYAKNSATVGIGAGQMSRLDSTRIAVRKSADAAEAMGQSTPLVQGSVVASDAFFPFADGLISAAEAGATAVIQPGGSVRDQEVIDAANERGLAMVFTGMRHFRH
ncbi:bifunctional phosphoribosylaminoimidazolecarboxamide formyltransferase/IMP cyclohydrolase [Parvularcula sp. LCG005]|uniref:bifunctional phosphoribosylaminoimidazolecarboxamide formyltransferase/IMP cyclohydrolase n=1 Tax=Parvularcula sp. LCG005 TaxID=3078805 RepID=UPI0029425081|nr:bifunctional phosphoribosylaminoimidazolecarboxamide formyltransferase/IMP cyclohydrolase [Parvularcula sp. LCG005]WOI53579.1 bifunctional phosphoribosylaminoimidazolecarboxamide formyltransferase/IMP cyclohydrolase [Parvularcula sp. LCG005]